MRDKWVAIGLSTEPASRPSAEDALIRMYRQAGLRDPRIVWCTSPLAAQLVRLVLRDSVSASVRDSVSASVRASVRASVSDSVSASVRDSVSDSVRDSVSASVSASVRASVSASVSASVLDSVRDSVSASVRDSVRDSIWYYHCGQAEWWLSFYDVFSGLVPAVDRLRPQMDLAESCGWCWLGRDLVLACERYSAVRRNARGALHCPDGPAVSFPDGWSIYALNGVRMRETHISTPPEDLFEVIMRESNVEIRRELLRRMGMENFVRRSGCRVLNQLAGYELLSIDLSAVFGHGFHDCRYLKMLNPSIGVWHVEGVAPTCGTVQEALNWRAGDVDRDWRPVELT